MKDRQQEPMVAQELKKSIPLILDDNSRI